MSPDIAALRAAFASDPAFPAVFGTLARGRDVQISSVRRLTRRRSTASVPGEAEVRRVFAQLAAWGFGEYLDPTLRHRARFIWRVRPKAVNRAAQGQLDAFGKADWIAARHFSAEAGAAAEAAPAGPAPLPGDWERHRLPLAPGREIELIFPPDLRVDEARWVGDYLERMGRRAAEAAKPERPAEKPAHPAGKPARPATH